MGPLLLLFSVFAGYLLMYRLYGRFISRYIFRIDPEASVPSVALRDDFDYVPTRKEIIFGHHFTSIAGTGPIVGPAIAIIWGWVPAVLWVVLGSIFIGAVHDFGVLIASMRNKGLSIAEITGKYLNRRSKIFFYVIGILELWIFIAVLGLVMSVIFDMYPESVFPFWLQIPVSIWLGYQIYHRKKNIALVSIIAVALLYCFMVLGQFIPVRFESIGAIPATGIWTIILLIYAYVASILPVTTLLQPRDYINAYQLVIAMVMITAGVILSSVFYRMEFVAPAFNTPPQGTPSLWPFMFITIACGAVSGFHAIVSSGTSSKQVASEKDALFVGYGSMLTEGVLAILVILSVAAGIGLHYGKGDDEISGFSAWLNSYSTWEAASGMASKIGAFVDGSANMIQTTGLPRAIALVVMGVFVASFAGTSLDTSARLQRYFIEELIGKTRHPLFRNTYFTTSLVVLSAAALAFITGPDGKGALKLWPLFGIVNQVLAALALVVLTIYLKKSGGFRWIVTGIPAIFMSVVSLWAAVSSEILWSEQHHYLLLIINAIIIIVAAGVVIEGLLAFLPRISSQQKNG